VKSANTAIAPSINGFAASYAARTRLVAASTLRTFGGSGAELDAVHLTPPEATCSLSAVEAALGADCGVDLRRAKDRVGEDRKPRVSSMPVRRSRIAHSTSRMVTDRRPSAGPSGGRSVAVPGSVPLANGPQTRPEAVARIQR
jgi:hypothetical protein